MIDQILKCLCILSGVTFLFKRLPLLINKLMNKNILYLLLGCFILYILYSVYKKWKEEKEIKEEKSPISLEERLSIFEERITNILEERFSIFEERFINILQENRPKGKKKN